MYKVLRQLALDEFQRRRNRNSAEDICPEDLVVPLSQGDIIDDCPILFWPDTLERVEDRDEAVSVQHRVVILTQACDLVQKKTKRAVVAIVHDTESLVRTGRLTAGVIRNSVRPGKVYGWYFLPADPSGLFEESLVSFRDLHTVPISILNNLRDRGKHVCRFVTPYREHMAQHLAVTYSRIGLPEPYESVP